MTTVRIPAARDVEDNAQVISVERIKEMIPHRYPMLMIDRVCDLVVGEKATGIKNVTANENFFEGHFPQRPVMPGVLIIEALAQTAAVLVVQTLGAAAEGKLVYFMSVENTKFRRPVVPGDQLKLHVEKVQNRRTVWKFSGTAEVDGQIVAESAFTAMILDN